MSSDLVPLSLPLSLPRLVPLTLTESSLLDSFRDVLVSHFSSLSGPLGSFGILQCSDSHLLTRHLMARAWDIGKAKEMVLGTIEWRWKYRIDSILERNVLGVLGVFDEEKDRLGNVDGTLSEENTAVNGEKLVGRMKMDKLEMLDKLVMQAHHGFDKNNRPVYIEKSGSIPVDAMMNNFTDAEMLHAHIWGMEFQARRAELKSREVGVWVDNFCRIIDLEGMSNDHNKLLEWTKPMTFVDQNYYPERLGVMFIINAPWFFSLIWTAISFFLDDKTRQKIHILGSDYKEKLHQIVDPSQLPPEYGGTCNGECGKIPCINKADISAVLANLAAQEEKIEFTRKNISAGGCFEEKLDVDAGQVVSWYIKTEANDIAVQVDFFSATASLNVILPKRFPTGEMAVQGSFSCPEAGHIIVKMDNSFAWFASKDVKYFISKN